MRKTIGPALGLLLLLSSTGCRDDGGLVDAPDGGCYPLPESCNGEDDDCNGEVDDGLERHPFYIDIDRDGFGSVPYAGNCFPAPDDVSSPVGGDCEDSDPGRHPGAEETCNGKDDDCDGQTDEDVDVRPCYPRDNSELLHGECRFGVERCVGGRYSCSGWIGPTAELCNGLDDDCDGALDEGSTKPFDLVFAIDYSGSMDMKIAALRSTTSTWATKYSGRADLRIALLGIPSDVPSQNQEVTVMLALSSPSDFVAELDRHPDVSNMSWAEPSLDAVYLLSQPGDPLGVGWTSGASHGLVVYTDEPPQSYLATPVSEQDAMVAASIAGLRVHVFTSNASWSAWGPEPFGSASSLEAELDRTIAEGSCQ